MTQAKAKTAPKSKVAPKAKKETSAPVFKLIEGAAAINTAIKGIATRGSKLEKEIHVVAVSCLNHAELHGDITLAQKLVEALPNMSRKNALLDWFQFFGKFGYDMEAKALTFAKEKNTDLGGAAAMPFWNLKAEAAYVPYDLVTALQGVFKRAQRAKEKGDAIPEELLNQLGTMVETVVNDPLAKAA